ncbi:recombinase RecT [Pedobacter sp. Leaf132]|uniref:recombinase RecT n=1 Tax=Pedobacter sp. Leaf132 TaxID=2876557 RepID=UPI001E351057|nr:recombinase RecT [Pedobacter sp. Leaf132]
MSTENQQQQTAAKLPAKFQEGTVDSILKRVSDFQSTGELVLPTNYVPENAVRAAWLMLQETVDRNDKPALEVCTKESIANAFLEMVTKGLSVVKKQCYFVVYGNKLSLEDSYIGKIAIAKREAGVKEVNAVTIYEGDVFEYENDVETGRKKIISHKQSLKNINPDKIVGAYAIVCYVDGTRDCEIMTLPQIQKAWAQGGAKGNSPAHKNFPDQMAEKTVINRALKIDVGSTDDSTLVKDRVYENVSHEIRNQANTKEIDFEDATVVDDKQTEALQEKEPSVLQQVGQQLAEEEESTTTERRANF